MASSKDCPYLSERRTFSPGGVVSSCFPPLPSPLYQHFSPTIHSYHLDHTWASCATHRKYRGPWKEISEEIKTKIQKWVFEQASEALKMKKCWTYPKLVSWMVWLLLTRLRDRMCCGFGQALSIGSFLVSEWFLLCFVSFYLTNCCEADYEKRIASMCSLSPRPRG